MAQFVQYKPILSRTNIRKKEKDKQRKTTRSPNAIPKTPRE